ncbi:gamma-glutamylcyclotransferase family protein [Vibrio cincinnatiensis]|uniref:gamma-glutamylcyclotransferase family protein n=1 Tax=Vibrio cincinnatiensis TaxID=675 RepID=UPI001302644C|nr:gamma-glutamylcyclotransferase [Vibrio cincinnatiensis]MCG3722230.1 gamma-glutamylcyclotransferase [Vibrio cincinnatiensis]
MHLVFVYGTLRQGEANHYYLEESPLLGSWVTPPEYALHDLGPYPGLSAGHQSIHGEVYQVDDSTLAKLDILEDVPVEYRRESLDTPYGLAWIYIYQDVSRLTAVIESGDWCQRI